VHTSALGSNARQRTLRNYGHREVLAPVAPFSTEPDARRVHLSARAVTLRPSRASISYRSAAKDSAPFRRYSQWRAARSRLEGRRVRITRRRAVVGIGDFEASRPLLHSELSPTSGCPRTSRGDACCVKLSDAVALRQRLCADVGDLDTFDGARVASLRARVDANEYEPSCGAVATCLLAELTADLVV
jgi:hypothetical protein